MKKKILALALSLALCVSLFPAVFAAGEGGQKTYEEAVAEVTASHSPFHQTFETNYGTIFVCCPPNPRGNHGYMILVCKAASAQGEGTTITLPYPRHSLWTASNPADTMELSEDGKTFTYSYHYDEPVLVRPSGPMLRPAGDFFYTVDLPTGEITAQEPEIPEGYNTYAAALERVLHEENSVVERTLEAPASTALLRYFQDDQGRRSYFLTLVYKTEHGPYEEGFVDNITLPFTRTDGAGQGGFPVYYTDRAPDVLTLSEDGTTLTYTYNECDYGSPYTNTVTLGIPSSDADATPDQGPSAQQPLMESGADFTDVPAGSWFERGVTTCVENGIMVGTGEGRFSPDTNLTTAECLTLALRLYDMMRGGDGTLETAPEDWGKIAFTLSDGTVVEGTLDNPFWFYSFKRDTNIDAHLCFPLEPEQVEWGVSVDAQAATVTLDGKTYTGVAQCWDAAGDDNWFISFYPDTFEQNSEIRAFCNAPHPNVSEWYRDTSYTAEKWGLNDQDTWPGFHELARDLGFNRIGQDETVRYQFANALAEAAGDLPKLYTVEALPDLDRDIGFIVSRADNIFALYEAGVLTGTDGFGTFDGLGTLTRAQAAVMVARVLDESQRIITPPTGSAAQREVVRTLEAEDCAVVLTKGRFMDTYDDYVLSLVYKSGSAMGDGTVKQLILPTTMIAGGTEGYNPTDREPDLLKLSEDKKTLVYMYRFDEPLTHGDTVYHEAGTYFYTVDLATGELSMTHTADR